RAHRLAPPAPEDEKDAQILHSPKATTREHGTFGRICHTEVISNYGKYRSALLQKDRGIVAVPGRQGARRFVVVTAPPTASPWSPLRRPLFRSLWIADVASNIGTWMHDAAAA